MSASHKKVIVRKFNRDWHSGYLHPSAFISNGMLSLLDLAGKVTEIGLAEVKWICFVREFNSGDIEQPERLLCKTFAHRPRSQGLWIRARLKDNDCIDGLAKNDLSLLDREGLFLVPPDIRSNTQRIFLPRQAVAELEVIAVVRTTAGRGSPAAVQESLFK